MVAGSAMFAMGRLVQLLSSGSPIDVEPPQVQSPEQPGTYSGPYEAGAVWAVLDGPGTVRASDPLNGLSNLLEIAAAGAYPLLEHKRHTTGELALELDGEIRCLATCFTPGLA